ncbi:MAG: hypothetical protein DDT42_00576 [candidate division WS2 bacterium]|uniref:Uncharacterized protein n=1 Tax=Psychracetigena formicireducens TaxID=2986056 RepID=A0A9E2BFN6_PSYF1|nr:hypothetical protein [Candidatus Psychracetigena formicireducens]MBT9144728.1 hypothetical protein [Candidatus Psychracetigena formicireducens]
MCAVTIYQGNELLMKDVAEYEYSSLTKILTCFTMMGEKKEFFNVAFLHWSELKDKLTIS